MNFLKRLTEKFSAKKEKNTEISKEIPVHSHPRRGPGRPRKKLERPIRFVDIRDNETFPGSVSITPEKITEEEQKEIVKRLGYHERVQDILAWSKSIGKPLSPNSLNAYRYSEKWRPLLEKFRQEFNETVSEIPLVSKVKRLQTLDNTYFRLRDMEDSTESLHEKIKFVDREITILSKIQEEIEGKVSLEQNNLYVTQFNNMSRIEFDKFRLNLIEKIKRYEGENKNACEIGSSAPFNGNSRTQPGEITQGESGSPKDVAPAASRLCCNQGTS